MIDVICHYRYRIKYYSFIKNYLAIYLLYSNICISIEAFRGTIMLCFGNKTALRVFLDNNIKRYDVGEYEKSVVGKRGKAEYSLCLSSLI